jgi:hypothetical protein
LPQALDLACWLQRQQQRRGRQARPWRIQVTPFVHKGKRHGKDCSDLEHFRLPLGGIAPAEGLC